MKTVLYLRYSEGSGQTYQSIEGQRRVCQQYAETHGLNIIGEYIDAGISGRSTDNREAFLNMIEDSSRHRFECVLLYAVDRFARSRADSAIYKNKLKKNGVRILYAVNDIPDTPEGIIMEGLMESLAEYYSAELSRKIRRGIHESAVKCHSIGGTTPLGYIARPDHTYAVDPVTAPIVQKIFELYDSGTSTAEICRILNAMGQRTSRGNEFNKGSLHRILRNEKYIGVFTLAGVRTEGGIPAIVEPALFARVQKRLAAASRTPNSKPGTYALTGRLTCGLCNGSMVGISGTGRNGQKKYYYACQAHRNKKCDLPNISRDHLEQLICEGTVAHLLAPGKLEQLAARLCALQQAEKNADNIPASLHSQLRDVTHSINNIMTAIEQGIITETTKQRLLDLENRRAALQRSLDSHTFTQSVFTPEKILFLLEKHLRQNDETPEQYHLRLLSTFVHSAKLFPDHVLVFFNLKENDALESASLPLFSPTGTDDPSGSTTATSGGAEGGRTPVRKEIYGSIYGCSLSTGFPSRQADKQAAGTVADMCVMLLTALEHARAPH